MTPRIIHHIVGNKQNHVVKQCLKSWQELKLHGFEVKIWNDRTIEIFVKQYFPFAYEAIIKARNHAEAADIARYLIVYKYGGHYYDWDIQLLNIDLFMDLINANHNGFILEDPVDGSLASEAFSAKEGEPYLHSLVEDIVKIYIDGKRDGLSTLNYSGPFRMRDTLSISKNSTQSILAVKDVFLYDYHEIKEMPVKKEEKPMIHYWLHSWLQ
jgi:hypothetical protein